MSAYPSLRPTYAQQCEAYQRTIEDRLPSGMAPSIKQHYYERNLSLVQRQSEWDVYNAAKARVILAGTPPSGVEFAMQKERENVERQWGLRR